MIAWLEALRRWVNPKRTASTSAATSVLFVLQAARQPMTLPRIQAETMIIREDLEKVLESLEWERRIVVTRAFEGTKSYAPDYSARRT